jgi:ribose transport system permease protein
MPENSTPVNDMRVPSRLVQVDRHLLRQSAPIITLIVLVIIVGILTPAFLTPSTLIMLTADTATLFIMAMGATFVIILGGIDLSLQTVASLASVILALSLPRLGYAAFLVTIVMVILIGLITGILHVRLKIPSFIVTLAASGVWAGVALIISDARSISIAVSERNYLSWITGDTFGIPHEVIIGGVVLFIGILIQRYTAFGRYSTAIGAGEPATWASGVRVNRYKITAFILSALMAGFSGIMLTARLASGSPTLANEFLLPAIASVIVGGTAITGGVGSVWRTLIGALIITVVRIGMTFVGVDVFAQQIVFGIGLIIAVAITIDRSKIPIVK